MRLVPILLAPILLAFSAAPLVAQAPVTTATAPVPAPAKIWPSKDATFVLRDFAFRSGERLPELRMRYTTLGTPHRDAAGRIDNAVMVLHGTGGSGKQFLQPQFADELYGPGAPLDIARTFVILPDSIGHGGSSKPSDGLRMRFPAYDYDDMVKAQRQLLVEGLGVTKLRAIVGTSMGCMHAFVWGTTHVGFAERLAPFACNTVAIAGRNRMWRQMAVDAIKADPTWAGGAYAAQPAAGLRAYTNVLLIAGANPLALQTQYPTRVASEAYLRQAEAAVAARGVDANDAIYQLESSRNYDPSPLLDRVTVPVLWINSADDFINPPELALAEPMAARMPRSRFVLIAASPETKGHGTHTWAKFWRDDLARLLATHASR